MHARVENDFAAKLVSNLVAFVNFRKQVAQLLFKPSELSLLSLDGEFLLPDSLLTLSRLLLSLELLLL